MRNLFALVLAVIIALQALPPAGAVNPDEVLSDPVLEQRARALSAEIRCLVCQNQSIDDSDAQLARDLRVLVREQLVEGKSDEQILDFLVERYGEFVLLKPRLGTNTLALWSLPFLALLVGGVAVWRFFTFRRTLPEAAQPLTDEEKAALQHILDERKK